MTAFREVEDALIAVQKTREQREAQEIQVTSLRSAFTWLNAVPGGRASYLDLLTAQRDLYNAELALARTQGAQLVSWCNCIKPSAAGGRPRVSIRRRRWPLSAKATVRPSNRFEKRSPPPLHGGTD